MTSILDYNIKKADQTISQPTLIIQLHGIGSNKDDLFSFTNELPSKFTIVSVQAPNEYYMGYAWYNLQISQDGYWSDLNQAKASVQKIDEFIDYATKKYQTQPKVVLMGFSQGTIISIATALKHPDKIKAIVAMSGYYNNEIVEIDDYNLIGKSIPVFAVHGRYDDVIPIDRAKATYKALSSYVNQFTFKDYPVAHGISPEILTDVIDWLNSF